MNENRRRTARYISDQHIMEKAMDRAKVKNLEAVSGMSTKPAIPNVLNTAHLTRVNFANKVGVEIGNTEVEFSNSIDAMKRFRRC